MWIINFGKEYWRFILIFYLFFKGFVRHSNSIWMSSMFKSIDNTWLMLTNDRDNANTHLSTQIQKNMICFVQPAFLNSTTTTNYVIMIFNTMVHTGMDIPIWLFIKLGVFQTQAHRHPSFVCIQICYLMLNTSICTGH